MSFEDSCFAILFGIMAVLTLWWYLYCWSLWIKHGMDYFSSKFDSSSLFIVFNGMGLFMLAGYALSYLTGGQG